MKHAIAYPIVVAVIIAGLTAIWNSQRVAADSRYVMKAEDESDQKELLRAIEEVGKAPARRRVRELDFIKNRAGEGQGRGLTEKEAWELQGLKEELRR